MTQQHESGHDKAVAETPGASAALSVVGGVVGTAVGSRRGVVGAAVGGVVGGTVGYLAGTALSPEDSDTAIIDEPISIDVTDPDSHFDSGTVNGSDDETSAEE